MEYGVNILVKAIDAAIAPIEKLQNRLNALFAPIEKLQKLFTKLGDLSGITRLANSIKGLQQPLKKTWEEAGKLVARFKTHILDVATQNEALALNLANVTGSADNAKAALAAVQASLRGWDTKDAANAYMALKRAGLGTSEADLKKLGDIAGHTGKSLTEVADAMASLKDGSTGGLADILGGNIRQFGDYIVAEFTDAEGKLRRMAVKQTGNAARDAHALQLLMNKAVEAKGMEGGAERFGQSWQGMLQRMQSGWRRFVTMVMDNGPFALLKQKFAELLATFDKLEASGGLQVLAEDWAKTFCDAIEDLWTSGEALVAWLKKDFLPAFENVKNFMGGWGGIFKALAAIMAGQFLLSLLGIVQAVLSVATALGGPLLSVMAMLTPVLSVIGNGVLQLGGSFGGLCAKAIPLAVKGILLLGKTLLFTPFGWIILAIGAVAGAIYLIYENWSKIAAFFQGLWQKVSGVFTGAWNAITGFVTGKVNNVLAAFDEGFLQGMLAIFMEFNPTLWIAEALDALGQMLFGFSLIDAGKAIVNSLLEGLKGAWQFVVDWLHDAWAKLTGWLPDFARAKLGIDVAKPKPTDPTDPAAPSGPPIGAAVVMADGAAAAYRPWPEQKIRTEVIIMGKNLPPNLDISVRKSQADGTQLSRGYLMPEAY